jgi:hypothetical protein
MRVRGLTYVACLSGSLALGLPAEAHADPVRPNAAQGASPGPSSAPTDGEADEATIVLVGDGAEATTLVPLLVERLGRQKIQLRFLTEPRFEPNELLARDEGDRAVWVFIEVTGERSARLYFRGPHGQHFLLRELALRGGLDELGRELVGQVLESSVATLLRSSEGMSREEVVASLSGAGELPTRSEGESEAPPPPPSSAARFAGWLGLRYEAEWSGSALGAAHGPGVEAGVEWRRGILARAGLSAQTWFAQTYASQEIKADIQTWPLLLSLDVGLPVARGQALLIGLAGGAGVVHVQPEAAADPAVTPAGPTTHLVPALRTAVRYEIHFDEWSLGITGFADISVLDTHYDLEQGTSTDQAAAPNRVRPGAALLMSWWPALGTP